MNGDFADIQYAQIREYKYAQWFKEVQYNGKTLSESERKEFISVIDSTITQYSEGLPLMTNILEDTKEKHDEYHKIDRIVVSVYLFVLITMIDSYDHFDTISIVSLFGLYFSSIFEICTTIAILPIDVK